MLFLVPLLGKMMKEQEDLLHKQEKQASMVISFILILLGIGVVVKSYMT